MSGQVNARRRHESYTVAFICAMNLEMSAVRYMLDREHRSLPPHSGDSNLYILGELSGYNVVLAWLSGNQGKGAAATVATNMNRSYPAIEWRFLIGIGGGVPSEKHDIRLGDVVISMPEGRHGGVVQYDLGKDEEQDFKLKGFLLPPPTQIRNAVELMRSNHLMAENKIDHFLTQMLQKGQRLSIYRRLPSETDVLFAINYPHDPRHSTCGECDEQKAISRPLRQFVGPEIHYGLIASGDRVMRSAAKRMATVDAIGDILCFEMEAAGIATEYPCIVIRGISDYADSHKNDNWQHYAAAVAAATAKELLACIPHGSNHEITQESGLNLDALTIESSSDIGHNPLKLQQAQDCAKSLAFEEMDNRINDLKIAAADGTCRWLLEHDMCADWSAQDKALLWIKGKPGSGKSTLLRYLLDNVNRTSGTKHKALVLWFFFHGRGVEMQRTPLGLFRSLLYQLLTQVADVNLNLVTIFLHRCETVGQAGKDWRWHLRELQEAFRFALANILERQSVWIFIDALDECGKESAIDLVKQFNSFLANIPYKGFQFLICFTCRHYPILNLDSTYEIIVENENERDISAYVDDRLSAIHMQSTSAIPELITTQAHGVFMWASLIVDRVLELEHEGSSMKRIEAEILCTPKGLYNIYIRLVAGMHEKSMSQRLFQWICFARRPLSLDELRWALSTPADYKSPVKSLKQVQDSQDYISDNTRMERRLKSLSCGLAEVVSASNMRVQFIHQSVRDFFIERGIAALNNDPMICNMDLNSVSGMAHYWISRTCIRYITMTEFAYSTDFDRKTLLNEFPLARYAATLWIEHAKESETENVSQQDLLDYFDWTSAVNLQVWLQVLNRICFFTSGLEYETSNIPHVVSQHQLLSPLRMILRDINRTDVGINTNTRDALGRTPLIWAAVNGHERVVKLLLEVDQVDVNVKDTSSWTSLMWAVAKGHKAIVELLLATKKADTTIGTVSGRSPLSWGVENEQYDIVQTLLAHDTESINLQDNEGRTPLWYATRSGPLWLAKLLVEKGAKLIKASDERRSILHVASQFGCFRASRLLLECGPNIAATDINNNNQTSLSLPMRYHQDNLASSLAENGANIEVWDTKEHTTLLWVLCNNISIKVVELLLKPGADIEKTNEDGDTPLLLAIQYCETEVIKLLVKQGANIETADKDGYTPLRLSMRKGRLDVIKLLIEQGAEIEVAEENGYVPLLLAIQYGKTEDVKHLIQQGVNVDVTDKDGDTPLYLAILHGKIEAIKLLIEQGVKLDATDEDSDTPLLLAIDQGMTEVVKLLIEQGVNLDVTDKEGSTPLLLAIRHNEIEVVKLLIEQGVKLDVMDEDSDIPLLLATYLSRTEVIQLLIEQGVNLDVTDEEGDTLLLLAIRYCKIEVVKLLIEQRVNLDATNEEGDTPLLWAIQLRKTGIIELLLENGADIKTASRRTPLIEAVLCSSATVVRSLLRIGADPNGRDLEQMTALVWAARDFHDKDIIACLLEHPDLDPALKDCRGRTYAYWAARCGIKWTDIESEASDSAKERLNSLSPNDLVLHAAVASGQEDVIRDAIDNIPGHGFAEQDIDGWTAMYTATRYKREKMVAQSNDLYYTIPATLRLKTPSSWHREDKSPYLHVSYCGYLITIEERYSIPKNSPYAAIRADHAIPGNELFYFEIEIIKEAEENIIGVGFCEEYTPLDQMLGCDDGTWGYHGDDGTVRAEDEVVGYHFEFSKGDIIGCGVDLDNEVAFFSKNGDYGGLLFPIVKY